MNLKTHIKRNPEAVAELARDLGVSEHAVRKWAYGQREPSIETALEIVRLTGGAVTMPDLTRAAAKLPAEDKAA